MRQTLVCMFLSMTMSCSSIWAHKASLNKERCPNYIPAYLTSYALAGSFMYIGYLAAEQANEVGQKDRFNKETAVVLSTVAAIGFVLDATSGVLRQSECNQIKAWR